MPAWRSKQISRGKAVNYVFLTPSTLDLLNSNSRGPGLLKGKRPLLIFHFDSLALRIGGIVLLKKVLPTPDQKRMPFFALIERNPDGWMAARGRGGGLALWVLKD